MTDVNFPQDFYLDDVGVWRLKKEKLEELEKPKPMTNEEWFVSLPTEEKAEYLADKFNEVVDFVLHEVDENAEDIEPDDYWYRQDVIVEWLKQPHTEKE